MELAPGGLAELGGGDAGGCAEVWAAAGTNISPAIRAPNVTQIVKCTQP
ncbi:MAG TPA: hypothetical protein VKW08_21345 [Xanthobacteraceae bacterium]|nr:hypothetical protein [Xanthobacteraceae bacterium]